MGTATVTYTVEAPLTAPITTPASGPTSTVPAPPTPLLGDLKQSHSRWREGGGRARISGHKPLPAGRNCVQFQAQRARGGGAGV
jgi:hypothetical protein